MKEHDDNDDDDDHNNHHRHQNNSIHGHHHRTSTLLSQVTLCIKGESLHNLSYFSKTFKDLLWYAPFKVIFHIYFNNHCSNFHFVVFLVRSTTLKVGALEVKRRISVKKAPLLLCPK